MFQDHRRRFLACMEEGDLALFPGAGLRLRSHDVVYPFRQQSDFWYLTGLREPDALLLLAKGVGDLPAETLFVAAREPEREAWTGPRVGPEGAVSQLGFAAAAPLRGAEARLDQALGRCRRLWYRLGEDARWDRWLLQALPGWRRRTRLEEAGPETLLDPTRALAELRLHKSAAELECMRRAAAITAEAHLLVMARAEPGAGEWELEALLSYTFRRHGADGWAYPPIVASGANACVLHYTACDRRLADGDLVLVDAGAEVAGYAADVTRVFPAGGCFSPPQRELYEIVLEAQRAAIAAAAPGLPVDGVHQAAVLVLAQGLRALGVLSRGAEEIVVKQLYRPWFMHNTSHWLGLDVHDAGRYVVGGSSRPLRPGMCLTVEPGLYFSTDDERVPRELRGLGVRIEDDLLITASGNELLTAAVPTHPAAVEEACAAVCPLPPALATEIVHP